MSSSNFASCLAFTLKYEGGKANNPKDPGGRTNEGITQRTYDAWRKKAGLAPADVYGITPADRDAIYRGGFWDAVKADAIPVGADITVFDFGVNSGPARALKAYAARTSNDGAVIAKAVSANRLSFLHALGTFAVFGKGWTARVAACEALGVKMAEHARIGLPVDAPTAPQVASKLLVERGAAVKRAARHKKVALGVMAAGGAAGGATAATTSQPDTSPYVLHVPTSLVVGLGLLVVLAVAYFVWRAKVQGARAAAYADVALTTLQPAPKAA